MEHRRYVVLRHEGVAVPHFDLMLESTPDGALSTWRTLDWPITGKSKVAATAKEITAGNSQVARYVQDDTIVDPSKLDVWWVSPRVRGTAISMLRPSGVNYRKQIGSCEG